MYVRKKVIKGHTYYYLVRGERHGKKVKQKVVQYLGPGTLRPQGFSGEARQKVVEYLEKHGSADLAPVTAGAEALEPLVQEARKIDTAEELPRGFKHYFPAYKQAEIISEKLPTSNVDVYGSFSTLRRVGGKKKIPDADVLIEDKKLSQQILNLPENVERVKRRTAYAKQFNAQLGKGEEGRAFKTPFHAVGQLDIPKSLEFLSNKSSDVKIQINDLWYSVNPDKTFRLIEDALQKEQLINRKPISQALTDFLNQVKGERTAAKDYKQPPRLGTTDDKVTVPGSATEAVEAQTTIAKELEPLAKEARKFDTAEKFVEANKKVEPTRRINALVDNYARGEEQIEKLNTLQSTINAQEEIKRFNEVSKQIADVERGNKSVVEQLSREAFIPIDTTIEGLSNFIDIGKRRNKRTLKDFYNFIERSSPQLTDFFNQVNRERTAAKDYKQPPTLGTTDDTVTVLGSAGGDVETRTAIPKELEPLAKEARKFDTAEEFTTKSKSNQFHGSQSKLTGALRPSETGTLGEGFYLAPTEDIAEYFGKSANTEHGKTSGSFEKCNIELFDVSHVKFKELGDKFGFFDFMDDFLKRKRGSSNFAEIEKAKTQLAKEGFDGISLSSRGETVVFPQSIPKLRKMTKQQLTEFFDQAKGERTTAKDYKQRS